MYIYTFIYIIHILHIHTHMYILFYLIVGILIGGIFLILLREVFFHLSFFTMWALPTVGKHSTTELYSRAALRYLLNSD